MRAVTFPRALGKYRVLAELGSGGMADVYLAAIDGRGGFSKLVVVKVLRPFLADEPGFLTMFLDEARLAARLLHANIVQTNEVGEAAGRHFIAMEYLDGQPLHRVLRRTPLRLSTILYILVEVLEGLHYAHTLATFDGTKLHVVHRDVSPHNVFITYDGRVKVVDFGIAKATDSSAETRTGVVKGKISYMAPEQARCERVDVRADIFSVGVMLWEAVVGARLWGQRADRDVLRSLENGKIPDALDARPEIPDALAAICRRALAPSPVDRYESAEAMRHDIEAYLDTSDLRASPRELGRIVASAFADDRVQMASLIDERMREHRSLPPPRMPELDSTRVETPSRPISMRTAPPPSSRRRGGDVSDVRSERTLTALSPRRRRLVVTGALVAASVIVSASLAALTRSPALLRVAQGAFATTSAASVASVAASAASAGTLARPGAPRCASDLAERPVVELTGEITEDSLLTCDKIYRLTFTTFVNAGATLTVERGTTLVGDHDTHGTLVVRPGGRLVADGSPDAPIVFTSERPVAERRAGDWGGVLLLGNAPTNLRDAEGKPSRGHAEGIVRSNEYGGDDPDDDSGVLRYVRIEYSGISIAPNNEINGLTLAGVGRKTVIDHVQIRNTTDDCFEFFGGTVNAKHLICYANGDDGFDWDYGYTGKLQFLLLVQRSSAERGQNGFEGDNDPDGTSHAPLSAPTIFNATLCGAANPDSVGVLLRTGSHGTVRNTLVTGFPVGQETRDRDTQLDVASSLFFGNGRQNSMGSSDSRARSPSPIDIAGCHDVASRRFATAVAIGDRAATPPDDGFFDPSATYLGALRDAYDPWATERWVNWDAH